MRKLTHPHEGGLTSGARLLSCATGLLLIGAGVIHVSAAADHTNLPLMMAGFLVVAYLQVALGGLLIARRPGRLLIAAGVAMTASSIGLWLISRTLGLQFLGGEHMEPIGFKDGVCVLFEIGTLPALLLLGSRDLLSLTLPTPRLGGQALGLLGAGMFALFVPALMLGGGHHHTQEELAGHEHGADGHQHEHGEELASAGGAGHGHGLRGHAHGTTETAATSGHRHSGGGAGALGAGHRHGGELAAGVLPEDSGHSHRHAGGGGHEDGAPGHSHGKRNSGHTHGKGNGHSHRRSGGGHTHGGEQHAGGGHQHPEAGAAGHEHQPEDPQDWSGTWKPAEPASNGKPAKGAAMVFRTPSSEGENGPGHSHGGACQPTAQQRAAADDLYRRTSAALEKYENNPAAAYLDGFWYQFGPTDRMIHMVNPDRVQNPTILDPNQIESFIYVMTDRGYMPVGGMYIMPEYGMHGPQPGGCLTQWHHHGGLIGRAATAGTRENTPEMLHVWTYPGLDPWGHYNGREMSQLWKPGSQVPSVCRDSGDAMDGCLP